MSLKPECVPCILNQALRFAKVSGIRDESIQFEILNGIYHEIARANGKYIAPHFSRIIQQKIQSYINIDDPYEAMKIQNIEKAAAYIPYLKTRIASSSDPLEEAVRAAILGNVIDMGANPDFNLQNEIDKLSAGNISLEDYPMFKRDIKNAEYVLYIADNAEEAVFDKLLLEQLLPRKIFFAVREVPILNDITIEFAERLGINAMADVISSGSTLAGTDMNTVNEHFKTMFDNAPIVIAKGQGNYETLLHEKQPIYFMFKVKCSVIAEICGKPVGMSVLYYNRRKDHFYLSSRSRVVAEN